MGGVKASGPLRALPPWWQGGSVSTCGLAADGPLCVYSLLKPWSRGRRTSGPGGLQVSGCLPPPDFVLCGDRQGSMCLWPPCAMLWRAGLWVSTAVPRGMAVHRPLLSVILVWLDLSLQLFFLSRRQCGVSSSIRLQADYHFLSQSLSLNIELTNLSRLVDQ